MRALLLAFLLVVSGLPALAADGVPAYADLLADCTKSDDPACAGQQTVLAPQWPKALAGDLPRYEDATRALFAGDIGRFDDATLHWPEDVRDHAALLAADAFHSH